MPIILKKAYIYHVREGDTVYDIARRYNSSVEEIIKSNQLYPPFTDFGSIFIGDVLVVPTAINTGAVSYIVNAGDSMYTIASRFSTFTDLVAGINDIESPNFIYPNQTLMVPAFVYEIGKGETLSSISGRLGVPLLNIIRANKGRPYFHPDVLWQGYQLIIPLPTSRNIVVWTPFPGMKITNGQRIEGQGRAFEANVLHQLRDANHVIVSNERFTTADIGAPAYGDFVSTLPFDRNPTSNIGELWVYTRSAKDGSIQDLVRITVYF